MHTHTSTILAYRLPKGSVICVSSGQAVSEGDVLAKTYESRETMVFHLSSWLLLRKSGEEIKKGDLVACKKGFFGLFSKKFHSPVDGRIEGYDGESGDLVIKLDFEEFPFKSDVSGRVAEVSADTISVEFNAIEIDGDTSYEGKKVGILSLIKISHDSDPLNYLNDAEGESIIAVDGEFGRDFLYKASALSVRALICSLDRRDFISDENFEKKLKVNSQEVIISLPVFLLEGEDGKIKEHLWEVLEKHDKKSIILDGGSKKIFLPV